MYWDSDVLSLLMLVYGISLTYALQGGINIGSGEIAVSVPDSQLVYPSHPHPFITHTGCLSETPMLPLPP